MESKQKERTNERAKKWQTQARTDTKRRLLSIIIGHNMRFTFVYDVGRCAWHQFLRLHFHTIFLTLSCSLSLCHCRTTYNTCLPSNNISCMRLFVCMTFNYLFFSLTLRLLFIMCTLKTKHNVCVHALYDIVESTHAHRTSHTHKSNKSTT